jgi:hypothetical protein
MAEKDDFGKLMQPEKGSCRYFRDGRHPSADSFGEPVVQIPQDQVRADGGKELPHNFDGICGAEQAAVIIETSQEEAMAISSQIMSFGIQLFIQFFIELLCGDYQIIHAVVDAILQYPPDVTGNIFSRFSTFQMIR